MAESAYDQRQQASRTADAQLVAARDGLKVAEAEKAQIEAQRRELNWRRGRTEVVAPADGIVSRRMATSAATPPAPCSMFRIVAKGEVELDAEVTETRMATVKIGQPARVEVPASARSSAPCASSRPRSTRRRAWGGCASFSATIPSCGSAPSPAAPSRPAAATASPSCILYGPEGSSVQVVRDHKVETRRIKIGPHRRPGLAEVREGLQEGELVVARSGTFLRDGDAAQPLPANRNQLSNAN